MYKTYFLSIILLMLDKNKMHSELKTIKRNALPFVEYPKLDINGLPDSQKNLNAARFCVCQTALFCVPLMLRAHPGPFLQYQLLMQQTANLCEKNQSYLLSDFISLPFIACGLMIIAAEI